MNSDQRACMVLQVYEMCLKKKRRLVYAGKALGAGERIFWTKWLNATNQSLRAPFCGRLSFRFQLVPDEDGHFYCLGCRDAYSQVEWHAMAKMQQALPNQKRNEKQPQNEIKPEMCVSTQVTKRSAPRSWQDQAPTGKDARVMTAEQMNALILGLDSVAASA